MFIIGFFLLSLAFGFECDPICNGCFGPNPNECDSWVKNAKIDKQGQCYCIEDWIGVDCSEYIGICPSSCTSWDSPTHCKSCVPNGYLAKGVCKCKAEWSGPACRTHESAVQQDCDPKWYGGCKGPTSYDCNFCISAAHRTYSGEWVCDDNWSGDDCSVFKDDQNEWYDRCTECTSPSAFDCTQCIEHAHLNEHGSCLCNDGWSGEDCKLNQPYSGACCPSWDSCYGQYCYECPTCVANAHKDENGNCVCDDFWDEDNCSKWSGKCDAKCLHGCTGPLASDCAFCVSNSHRNFENSCECDKNWGDPSCKTYVGSCHPICETCNGSELHHCTSCVAHASFDDFGICECDRYWSKLDCSEFVYKGLCNPRCSSCTGPGIEDCVECAQNASKNGAGICVCDENWQGESCGAYTYMGTCDPICVDCTGPSSRECLQCVEHAYRNATGICVCETYHAGSDCAQEIYDGPCHDYCSPKFGCEGPSAADCFQCVANASRTEIQGCTCDQGWGGEHCQKNLATECDPTCLDCSSKPPYDCISCRIHSHLIKGKCVCDNYWAGDECSIYLAPCHPICDGCHGPAPSDCQYWVEHASKHANVCRCDMSYTGESCATYTGKCSEICASCFGPSNEECLECVPHARFETRYSCVCEEDWFGQSCEAYVGPCDLMCEGCYGPGDDQWVTCIDNATFNVVGVCECEKNWIGHACQKYTGNCMIRCSHCNSPVTCSSCVANASFNENGSCMCDTDRGGILCQEFLGTCHSRCSSCHGATAFDCVACVANAYRNSYGKCVCLDDWRGGDCSGYSGACSSTCLGGCQSPDVCLACIDHSHLVDSGTCICDIYWIGALCESYTGSWDIHCAGCLGPTKDHCITWAQHAVRNDLSWECEQHWSGLDCSVYEGPCHYACNGCFGPGADDCLLCVPHAGRSSIGECVCEEGWGYSDCSVYQGQCSPLCEDGCTGPKASQCISCVEHADIIDGECTCQESWLGRCCEMYAGLCHATCLACFGPEANECSHCQHNASRDSQGYCKCNRHWTGDACELYGNCSKVCAHSECTGPEPWQCDTCTINALRDSMGNWVCAVDWFGNDCAHYIGICDSKCKSCIGPTSSNCVICTSNAKLNFDGACTCLSGWTGSSCDIWRGACSGKCRNCVGPSTVDCTVCVENAYRDESGACVCLEGWNGDHCELRVMKCDKSCLNCNGPDANQCIHCRARYVFQDGYCLECHSSCQECFGTSISECLSCPSGYTLSHNKCVACHGSWLECDDVGEDNCTLCMSGSTLLDHRGHENGICRCDQGLNRHPNALTCSQKCPTGYLSNPTNHVCLPATDFKMVFDYSAGVPQFEKSLGEVHMDSCNPPIALKNRGSYFSGIKWLEFGDFELNSSFYIQIYIRMIKGGSILAYRGIFFEGWEDVSNIQRESGQDEVEMAPYDDLMHFYITYCGGLIFDFSTTRLASAGNEILPGKWNSVELFADSSDLVATSLQIFLDGGLVIREESEVVFYTSNMPREQLFLGTIEETNFFKGYIYDFVYSIKRIEYPFYELEPDCDYEVTCLPLCSFDEFLDDEGACVSCDSSCSMGCSDASPCADCHSTCKECSGPEENQCESCYCDAHIGHDDLCNCDSGFRREGNICVPSRCPDNCQNCDMVSHVCLQCVEGYIMYESYCNPCTDNGLCTSSWVSDDGQCACGKGEYFRDTTCVTCSPYCNTCARQNGLYVCTKCDDGLGYFPISYICSFEGATGLNQLDTLDWVVFQPKTSEFTFADIGEFTMMGYASVKIHSVEILSTEKYLVRKDRGLWFDGINHVLLVEHLYFYHTFSLATWIQPASTSFTIYSASAEQSQLWSTVFKLSVSDAHLQFQADEISLTTTGPVVDNTIWQQIGMTAEWSQTEESTQITLYTNNSRQISQNFNKLLYDYGDYQHFVGSSTHNSDFKQNFHGFLYSLETYATRVRDFENSLVMESCPCSSPCPENVCLTKCKWDSFLDEWEDCIRCPTYCKYGCEGPSPGVCTFS